MKLNHEMKKNLLMITYAGILLFVIIYFSKIVGVLSYLWHLLIPFVIGFAISFVLNIIIHQLENTLFKNIKKNKRIFSFITMFILIITFIGLICFIVGPELIRSIKTIMKQAPIAYKNTIHFLKTNRNIMNGSFTNIIDSLLSLDFDLENIFNQIARNWKPLFNSGFSMITNTFSSLSSFFIGFVFSIYLLFSKESLSKQLKIVSQTLLGYEKTNKICQIIKLSSDTFTSFITCQCLEACILGMMFIVSMFILKMPYALLMGIIIAITALIPVFGAFIGCFIGIIMIGIVNPLQAVAFVVLFLILQQIEGNFIYPHVVGNSVGLPSIWVFVAVIIGGNLMGILGMFLFIPLTSIFYTLFKEYIKTKNTKISS